MAVKILVLLLFWVVSVTSECHIMAIQECNRHDLVSNPKFHAFVPKDKFDETCRNMDIVLKCIYQKKYMDGCTVEDTFFYDMQRDVVNRVCTDGEYLKHVDCLGNQELEDRFKSTCMQSLADDCESLIHVRTCITSQVLSKCGQEDSDYMDVLAYLFLRPISKPKSCNLEVPEMMKEMETTTEDDVMTTNAVTKTITELKEMETTTEDVTMTTNAVTMSTPKTTTESLCSLTAPSFLVILQITKLGVWFRVWSLW